MSPSKRAGKEQEALDRSVVERSCEAIASMRSSLKKMRVCVDPLKRSEVGRLGRQLAPDDIRAHLADLEEMADQLGEIAEKMEEERFSKIGWHKVIALQAFAPLVETGDDESLEAAEMEAFDAYCAREGGYFHYVQEMPESMWGTCEITGLEGNCYIYVFDSGDPAAQSIREPSPELDPRG